MISRRGFIRGVIVLAVATPWFELAAETRSGAAKPILAYVGTYSSPHGNGRGIHLFHMDPATGALSSGEIFANDSSPSWLALNAAGTRLYAVNEFPPPESASKGSVSAFAIDQSSGHLTLLNTVDSGGAGPGHLSIHPAGKRLLVANYGGGSLAVLSIGANGELLRITDVKKDNGALGLSHATSAAAGSFAISGHDKPHPHMIQADLGGRFVLSTDIGLDQILIWKFDDRTGTLSANDPALVSLPAGDGPRHFAFHPDGRRVFSVQEEGSTLAVFDYDAHLGTLKIKQIVSSLPSGFAGTSFASGIVVSPDGKFVYVGNRLHDSIAIFSIGLAGTLTLVGEEWTQGDYPRSFSFDPTGNFIYSCNQRSDAVTTFRVDRKTGGLTFTGQYTPVGSPAAIVFLDPGH